MEKIEVRYKKVSYGKETPFYHKYIVYTNSNGEQFYARGGPDGDGINDKITTIHGEYIEGTKDWDKEHDDPRETIIEGDDLSSYWDGITQAMDDIKVENHP